jgi:hypothetical protein
MISKNDIIEFRKKGSWRVLEKLAWQIALDAEKNAGVKFTPLLGGGTRLMLAMNHRISHDIDLFVNTPQWLGYLTPRKNDFLLGTITDYVERGDTLKLHFPEGEIDFIVRLSLIDLPAETSSDTSFLLEPVAEVLTKKLFYRGWALTSRDLYDWWAIEMNLPDMLPRQQMAEVLKGRFHDIQSSLQDMKSSNFALKVWNENIITDIKPSLHEVIEWAENTLEQYQRLRKVASPDTPKPLAKKQSRSSDSSFDPF